MRRALAGPSANTWILVLLLRACVALGAGAAVQPAQAGLPPSGPQAGAAGVTTVMRYGIDPSWYPIEYVGADGKPRGMTIDYLEEMSRLNGMQFEWVPTENWEQTLDKLAHGEIDMIPAASKHLIEQQHLAGSAPYFQQILVLVLRADDVATSSLAEVAGAVAVQQSSSAQYWLVKSEPQRPLILTRTANDAVRAVVGGQARAAVLNAAGAAHLAQTRYQGLLRLVGLPRADTSLHLAVRAGLRDAVPELNRVLGLMGEAAHARLQRDAGIAERIVIGVPLRAVILRAGPFMLGLVLLVALFWHWNRRLARARRAADSANYAKSRYLAMMGHELRTPLSGVVSALELLRRKPDGAWQTNTLDNVLRMIRAQLNLIDDLIDMEKAATGVLSVKALPCDIGREIETAIEFFVPHAQRKRLDLIYTEDEALPACVEIDGSRLRQILHNFMNNAFRFTDAGSIEIAVTLRPGAGAGADGDRLVLSVVDTGIGIPRSKLGSVLQPFFQAHETTERSRGGSGLGLTICDQLARLMRGEISLESDEGKGTRVSVSVPLIVLPSTPARPLAGVTVRIGANVPPHQSSPPGELPPAPPAQLMRRLDRVLRAAGAIPVGCPDACPAPHPERRADQAPAPGAGLDPRSVLALDVVGGAVDASLDGTALLRILAPGTGNSGLCPAQPFLPRIFVEQCETVLLCGAKPAAPQPGEAGNDLLAGLRQPTVLLVEDDRFLQHVLQQQFARIGLQIDLAPDGQAALACWMERRHELVLTDINVPLLSGIELARQIAARAGAERRDVVIIGQSADTAQTLHALGRESGMREVLAKPVGDDTIRRIIAHYFN